MSRKAKTTGKTPTTRNTRTKFRTGGKGGKSPTDPFPKGRKITQRERTERPRGRDKDIQAPPKGRPDADDGGMWEHLGDQ